MNCTDCGIPCHSRICEQCIERRKALARKIVLYRSNRGFRWESSSVFRAAVLFGAVTPVSIIVLIVCGVAIPSGDVITASALLGSLVAAVFSPVVVREYDSYEDWWANSSGNYNYSYGLIATVGIFLDPVSRRPGDGVRYYWKGNFSNLFFCNIIFIYNDLISHITIPCSRW